MVRIDRAGGPLTTQGSSSLDSPDPVSATADTTPAATGDGFSVRSEGEAPVLSPTPATEQTPAELKAALLSHHVSQRRPGKNSKPPVHARASGRNKTAAQQPAQTARLRNRAAENMVRAQVDGNLGETTPAPFGGAGMGAVQITDPTAIREKLTGSAGWAELSTADQATLTTRFDAKGPAGAGMQMRLNGLMNHPRWQAAGSSGQSEALQRLASQPAPQGGFGMGMGGSIGGGMAEPPPAPSIRKTQDNLRASDGFRALSATEQRGLTARVGLDNRRGEATRRSVQQSMDSAEWPLMDSKGRAQRLRHAQMGADGMARSATPQGVVQDLEASPGFRAMGTQERTALRDRAAAPGEMALRSRLNQAMKLPEFQRASPQRQEGLLREIAADTPVFKMPTRPPAGATGLGHGMTGGGPGKTKPVPSAGALKTQLTESGALRHLAPDERHALSTRLNASGDAGEALRGALGRTIETAQWSLRTSGEQAQSLRSFLGDTRSWPTSGEAAPGTQYAGSRPELLPRDAIAKIKVLPGFAQLSATEQARFEGLMSGERNPLSREARRQVETLAYGLEPDAPRVQAQGLRRFLKEGPHVPGNMDSIDVVQTQRFQPKFGAARSHSDFTFRGATADATVQTVRINGHNVDIYAPATQPDLSKDAPHLPSVQDIAAALAHLPPESLETVERVVINPVRNPDDGYWAENMERPGFRANATAGRDGNMTFYPMSSEMTPEALGDVARHEAGHFNSFDTLYENEDSVQSYIPDWAYGTVSDWEDWQEAASGDGTVASRYGAENQDEDYAETYALYMGTRGTPLHAEYRQVFPNRFELLDGLVAGPD